MVTVKTKYQKDQKSVPECNMAPSGMLNALSIFIYFCPVILSLSLSPHHFIVFSSHSIFHCIIYFLMESTFVKNKKILQHNSLFIEVICKMYYLIIFSIIKCRAFFSKLNQIMFKFIWQSVDVQGNFWLVCK